jgi:tight adherence protein B
MSVIWLIGLLNSIAVVLGFVAVYHSLSRASEVHQRLAQSVIPAADSATRQGVLFEQLNRRFGRLSFSARLEKQLAAASMSLTVTEYLMLRLGTACAGLLLGWLVSGAPAGGAGLSVLGYMAPALVMQQRRAKRGRDFADQIPNMLSLIVGSLRSGYGLLQACQVIQDEMPDPMASEFAMVVRETTLGVTLDAALEHLVERMENDDLELIIASIQVQNEVGGSLAEVLETIAETVRERIQLKGEVRALTAQQRMSGWLLTGLPFGVATIMMLVNPDYMMGLFEPGLMRFIAIGAVVMIVVGNIVMRLVTRIEV